ncbi:MAG: prenyltransferase [Thermoplasmatota archaeon]
MNIRTWARASRAPFFIAVIIPAVLGGAVAHYHGSFDPLLFLVVAAGMVLANAGTNFINDYFDFRSGADVNNRNRTPFSGGSPFLPAGALEPRSVLHAGLACFGAALVVALCLSLSEGWVVLALAGVGAFIAFFYTAPPLRLGYRGFGELLTGLALGPLTVMGTYYVMAGAFAPDSGFVSIPLGVLVATILFVNEVPDYEVDRRAGKRHLVVLLGRERAVRFLPALFALAYATIAAGAALGLTPMWTLAGLLTLPAAVRVVRVAGGSYEHTPGYIPAMSGTIAVFLTTGALLAAGYVVAAALG